MNNNILINVTPQETRVAVMEQGVPQEIHVERASARGLVGNIYLGRVARVLPGMQSAFVDIGLERAAFLHVADIFGARSGQEEHRPIERMLSEGQPLLVQVSKDAIGTKGARLTTQIGIAGRMLVHLPQEKHIGVSQRIEDEAERNQLRERLTTLLAGHEGGFIVRTMAEGATDRELLDDSHYLMRLWAHLREASLKAAPPALLYQDLSLALRVVRDFITDGTERVVVDSRETLQKLREFCQQYSPDTEGCLEHYSGERPLFDLFGVEDEIVRALSRRVDLKSGGYLVIDQTEALTTVDVNTGAFVGGRNFDDTVFRTNLEAAQSIARQLRLRNLGGIIIADFIDMESTEHRDSVLAEFRKALSRDRTRITVNGFTTLGLVELTRKRTRESLAHVLCEICPTCSGRGELRTAQTVCYDILREIVRTARQFPQSQQIRILASQKVIDLFLDEESHSLAELSDFIGKEISLQVQSEYSQENFDVVLS
ncbi:MAG: ribonuclease G [Pseudomonadota bacterium]|nr:ribonuclease G [Pseudomonadota bacterium]